MRGSARAHSSHPGMTLELGPQRSGSEAATDPLLPEWPDRGEEMGLRGHCQPPLCSPKPLPAAYRRVFSVNQLAANPLPATVRCQGPMLPCPQPALPGM